MLLDCLQTPRRPGSSFSCISPCSRQSSRQSKATGYFTFFTPHPRSHPTCSTPCSCSARPRPAPVSPAPLPPYLQHTLQLRMGACGQTSPPATPPNPTPHSHLQHALRLADLAPQR